MHKSFLHIAREGWPLILLLAAGGVAAHTYGPWWTVSPFAVVTLALLVFFHDGERDTPAEPLAVVAPTDGRVIEHRECRDPFLERDSIRLSIRVAPFGQYFLRAPVEGTVLELTSDAASGFDGTASWIRTDEGDDVVIAVPAGRMFGARPCLARYGERVGQGRRCGVRRLAHRMDLYLPVNARTEVDAGQKVAAGSRTLATLVHKTNGNGHDNGA